MQSPDSSCATENSRLSECRQRRSRWQTKPSPLLYERHNLCPSLCVSLHLLCISLLPCRKKQFFCSLFQPIRKWIGGSFRFPVFPRRYGLRPSSPDQFPTFVCFSRKPRRVITWRRITIIIPLSLSALNMWQIRCSESSGPAAASCQRTRLWWKQCDASVTYTLLGAERQGDQTDSEYERC